MSGGLRILIAKLYSHFAVQAKKVFGPNISGLGVALRLINRDFVYVCGGRKMFFNHKISAGYGTTLSGAWHEPETHLFLRRIIENFPEPITFINVGACIGEYVIDLAGYPKIAEVIAFEPQPEGAEAIRRSAELNEFRNVRVIERVVNDTGKEVRFHINPTSPTGSQIVSGGGDENVRALPATTLDAECPGHSKPCIILIDAEGAELQIIRGAKKLFSAAKPLLIFEYNDQTKKVFSLEEFQQELGGEYDVFRIREDSKLDKDFSRSWNCVAVPRGTSFENILATQRL